MKKFTSSEKLVFNWVLIAVAVVGVVCNGLLIHLTRRLQQRTAEHRFIMLLACVDVGVTLLTIGGSFFNNWVDDEAGYLWKFCIIKGPIDFLLRYISFLLVALIAMERLSKVRDSSIPAWMWIFLSIYTAVFTSLILVTALRSEFYKSPSGVDCAPISRKSIFSSAALFGLGLFMFISLLITLCCYLGILCHVQATRSNANVTRKPSHVLARVAVICVVYLLLISPCSILIMVQATYRYKAARLISLSTTLLLEFNLVANACITLFAHSLIFEQLRRCLPFGRTKPTQLDSRLVSMHDIF
ncbi:hypothetical protein DSO57_1015665 [Entomophthora muscae]|uniref:Uncharacterized protein n=1 Tax=Entomophthora muscae TaxID=34485 RepID=A0ACC2UEL0_9FUNG|nr:hypothetical protein DSO57_1015665 [Entomophthora muscae]